MRRCARKPSLKPSITLASLAQATVAVFMAEVLKLPFCVAMTAWSCGGPTRVWDVLRSEICELWRDALKCAATAASAAHRSRAFS